jgi:16S rRNA (guanine527-N7)-methyltransferase
VIDEWLDALVATPGLTAFETADAARGALLEDSLRGADIVRRYGGPLVDVGSGGGVPGIPLAHALPQVDVTLLEANGRKAEFLRRFERELPNVRVVQGRAECQPIEGYNVAVAKALAPPPVAAEWCLPLLMQGGAAILWVGPSADEERVASVARQLGGELVQSPPGFLVLRKVAATPSGFPRRPGLARKRPLK